MNKALEQKLNERVGIFVADELAKHLNTKNRGHCIQVTDLKKEIMVSATRLLNNQHNTGLFEIYTLVAQTKVDLETWEIHATKLVERRNAEEKILAVFIPHDLKTAAEDSFDIATFEVVSFQDVFKDLSTQLLAEVFECLNETGDGLLVTDKVDKLFKKINTSWKVPSEIDWCYYLLALLEERCSVEAFGKYLPYLYLIPDKKILDFDAPVRIKENISIMQNLRDVTKSIQSRVNGIHTARLDIKSKLLSILREYATRLDFDNWIRKVLNDPSLWETLDFINWDLEELSDTIQTFTLKELKGAALLNTVNGLEIQPSKGKLAVHYEVIPAPPYCDDWAKVAIHLLESDATEENYNVIHPIATYKKPTTNKSKQSKSVSEKNLEEMLSTAVVGNIKIGIQALTSEGQILASAVSKEVIVISGKTGADDEEVDVKSQRIVAADGSDIWMADMIDRALQKEEVAFETENYDVVMDENSLVTEQIKVTSKVTNKTFNLSSNVLLNKLHRLVLEKPDYLGIIKVPASQLTTDDFNVSAHYYEEKNLVLTDDLPAYEQFMSSRKFFFNAVTVIGEYHWDEVVSLIERRVLKRFAQQYIDSYNELIQTLLTQNTLDSQNLISRLQTLDCVAITDSDYGTTYLMTPTHPLKIAWQINYETKANKWLRDSMVVENKKKELAQIEGFLKEQTSKNYPFLLKDKFNKWYGNMDVIGRNWGVYVETAHLSDEYYKFYIQQLLQIDKSYSVSAKFPTQKLKSYVLQYLEMHPYLTGLTFNIFEPGDGQEIVQLLNELYKLFYEEQKYSHFMQLRIQLHLFTNDEKLVNTIGKKIDQLMKVNEKTTQLQDRVIFATENMMFPLFSYSKHHTQEFFDNPEAFDSHLTIMNQLLDVQFGYVQQAISKRVRSTYLNGLKYELTTTTSGKSANDSMSIWNKFISSNYELADEQAQSLNELLDTFTKMSMYFEKNHEQDVPAITMKITAEQKKELQMIHESTDWLLLLDEYLGPDFLDRPASGRERYHLIDYSPGAKMNNMFVSTNRLNEVETIVEPAMKGLDISIEEEMYRGIIDSLNAISGRLVLKLNSVNNQIKGAVGLALSRLFLSEVNRIGNSGKLILLPLDSHTDWFRQMESRKMTDLLAIMCDPMKRTITFNLVEVKWRSRLSHDDLIDAVDFRRNIEEQLQNSELLLKNKFDFSNKNETVRLQQTRELMGYLKYYLERSLRFKSISEVGYNEVVNFISRLDEQHYDIIFSKHALLFVTGTNDDKMVHLDGVTYHQVGKQSIERLLNSSSKEFKEETVIFSDDQLMDRATYFFKPPTDATVKGNEPAEDIQVEEEAQDEKLPVTNVEPDETQDDSDTFEDDVREQDEFEDEFDEQDEFAEEFEEEAVVEPVQEPVRKQANSLNPDIFIGNTSPSKQFGLLGKEVTSSKKIALDLNGTNTISLFGVQGSGKSYSIGTIVEMAVKEIANANELPSPLASVIFHYSKSETYQPEYTTFNQANAVEAEIQMLQKEFGIHPEAIEDIVLLTPSDKLTLRKQQYPSIDVQPLYFNTSELSVEDWNFLMGTAANSSLYIRQLKSIIRMNRHNLKFSEIEHSIEEEEMEERSKKILKQRLNFVREYIDDTMYLKDILKPGRIIIVDVRDEFIEEDEALGLFMVMLRIFSDVMYEGRSFNKLIVFDEAHKFMKGEQLMGNVIEVIREMRHKGVSVLIASQNPPSVPKEIIELSNIVVLHKFNAPAWLKHIQKSLTAAEKLSAADLNSLNSGEAYVWASKSTHKLFEKEPQKVKLRPRITHHGGATKNANDM
ncbi:DUF853 family protein [Lysinibacillus sp. CD3-6]|uniref:ATP-binding protein n=1 Tax=Lysinibacillus sp. CD3-6 TaxID=2892541 RepID=UPI001171E9A4|nr:DUF853 family protein [Lysinibacillus sp. CD3-6]UED79597.1 DUF853 family protein [Lysinibacillus sp. CD3-6]